LNSRIIFSEEIYMKLKKFIAAVIIAIVTFLLLSVSASAAQASINSTETEILLLQSGVFSLGSTELENPVQIGSGTMSYNAGVLTLDNVNFSTSADIGLKIRIPSDITINLIGTNSITCTNTDGSNSGIDSYGGISFIGTGSLTVRSGDTSTSSRGIYISGAYNPLSVSGCTVTVIGGAGNQTYGILTEGDITVSGGGSLIVSSGNSTGSSFAIMSQSNKSILVDNGYLSAVAGSGNPISCGINGPDITVRNGGSVNISGGSAAGDTDVTLTDGDGNVTDLTGILSINVVTSPIVPEEPVQPAPEPAPAPEPEPTPVLPTEIVYQPIPPINPPAPTYKSGDTLDFTSNSGVTSTVTVTDNGVIIEAGINESGSVNSEATAAAVKKAAEIAKANGDTGVTIQIPEGATGLSAATVQKLVNAADGLEIVLVLTSIQDGEEVGSISLPINNKTGQILTGFKFDTKNIQSVQNYISRKWNTDILGSFETAQKGGWGGIATLSISADILGFSVDKGTNLYALIYDTKTGKIYQVPATIEEGNVVIKTKRTGVVTIVTERIV
jgi:hypothetical protein